MLEEPDRTNPLWWVTLFIAFFVVTVATVAKQPLDRYDSFLYMIATAAIMIPGAVWQRALQKHGREWGKNGMILAATAVIIVFFTVELLISGIPVLTFGAVILTAERLFLWIIAFILGTLLFKLSTETREEL